MEGGFMNSQVTALKLLDARQSDVPLHRSIVAVDLEGSTTRTNLVKGELRRGMYDLLARSLSGVAIADSHLEPWTDRGDGVMLLIRPHDDVPKTVLLSRWVPMLAALLTEYNAEAPQAAFQMRLRAVVHAGEVHADCRGFYGEAIDVAIRLLDSAPVKRALRQASSPLVLVVSEEIYSGIVCQGYVDSTTYRPLVRVSVANRQRRGWVHVPNQGKASSAISLHNGLPAHSGIPLAIDRSRRRTS
jgi:hypothetical protein